MWLNVSSIPPSSVWAQPRCPPLSRLSPLLQGDTGGPFNHRIQYHSPQGALSTLGLCSQQSVDGEAPWLRVEGCGEEGGEACSESPAHGKLCKELAR